MFYTDKMDKNLRFGDIVRGFISIIPKVNNFIYENDKIEFNIDVNCPKFFSVMTPCCSIEDKTILLTPLQEIQKQSFFDNPYFKEDLTRINRPATAEQTMHPMHWAKLTESEKIERQQQPLQYGLKDVFIYEGRDKLPHYRVNLKGSDNMQINYYMISFKNIYKVNCDKIDRNKEVPQFVKYAQLSALARKDLREKVADYFHRIPDEDKLELEL